MTPTDPAAPTALDRLRIAEPCPMRWEDMAGDERRRFCGACKLHVYDVAAMSRTEAEALLSASRGTQGGGRLCLRLTRRADGRVVTEDCGPVRRTLRRRARRLRLAASALLAMLFPFGAAGCGARGDGAGGGTGAGGSPAMGTPVLPPELGDVGAPPALVGEVCLPDPVEVAPPPSSR